MTNVESMDIRTLTHPPLLASLVTRNFRRYHNTHHYLPQNSHHTYLLWHFHSHFEIYCHATFHHSVYYDTHHHCHIALHDCKIASMMFSWLVRFDFIATLDHCTSWYTAGGIHIESYFVLASSCNF